MKRHLVVFGTRPEAIKMIPIYLELLKHYKKENVFLCVTGQHDEMLYQVLDFFNVKVDVDLKVMGINQSLSELSAKILVSLDKVFKNYNPDYVYVHGDTTTSTISALAAFYNKLILCHIEAGLRSNNKYSPFPEEMNRRITSKITDYHFTPTIEATKNLISEGIDSKKIFQSGNTVIDALKHALKVVDKKNYKLFFKNNNLLQNDNFILITIHRRENFGLKMIEICEAIKKLSFKFKHFKFVFPVHLNPNIRKVVNDQLNNIPNILLIEPLDYGQFVWAMKYCKIILSDSGGVQEEGPFIGKPIVVLRENTERPEAVENGVAFLVGSNKKKIISKVSELILDIDYYNLISKPINIYGDGNASKMIINYLKKVK
jgi:UDP-N-acetylglucosamine 2-epimerase (non-hydrolysing)